jgi:Glycosyl transferase family 2
VGRARLTLRAVVGAAAAGAAAATAHTLLNLRMLRTPSDDPPVISETVSVLVPVRDEAHRVGPCLASLLAQERAPDLQILVLDDQSSDDTGPVLRSVARSDPRVRILSGDGPPPGWLGKPAACDRLAAAANGAVLVFVDADVRLQPLALAATVALLRDEALDLVSPYPRQLAKAPAERLVQPLLQWSWLTFLPVRLAERSPRPSLVAANGQLIACDAAAYRSAGGHAAVRHQILDDVELAKAFKRAGRRVAIADGTNLAECRMYASAAELRDGYSKSLWAAFGSPAGAAAVTAVLLWLYVVPPVAALVGRGEVRRLGLVGTAAAVVGRAVVARRVRSRVWPDSALHPLSVLALVALTNRSFRRHRRGGLTWKGRAV